jgi:two-component system, sensor histidine kinase PdtaS
MTKQDGAAGELKKVRQHADVLSKLAYLASARTPAEGLLDAAVTLVGNAIEVEHVKILRYRPLTGDLILEAGTGWREGVVGSATFPIALSSPPGRAYQTGQPVVIPDIRIAKDYQASPILLDHGIVSLLNVPLQIDGAAWGVFEADSTHPCDYSADTQDFLMTAGWIVASGIRREQVARAHTEAVALAADGNRKAQLLLEEMQHRVKNNFQTILAMIAIQGGRVDRQGGSSVLQKIADGIMAMSLAHNQLAPSQQGEAVHLPTYLRALAANIQQPLERITVEVKADEILAPIEKAVPLGLIVNELVTNSVKHAYDESGGGIFVELSVGPRKGEARLIGADNGAGIDPAKPGGSGLRLVDALVRQIRGRIERNSSNSGVRDVVTFSLES